MKRLRYLLEAFGALLLYGILRLLPLSAASAATGWLAVRLGPLSRVHRVARHNLACALPELPPGTREQALLEMWNNLGRVVGEYPHLYRRDMMRHVETVEGIEHLHRAMQSGKPVFLVSGHLGNWELCPVIAAHYHIPLHLLYRPANNPVVDRLIAMIRSAYTRGLHEKGASSARAMVTAIRNHEPVGLLFDQKTNDGIEVPLFGQPAMTSDILAQLVLKYDALVVPARCIRLTGACRFRCVVETPLAFDLAGQHGQDAVQAIMRRLHTRLEDWIREDPSQWFWVHKRWPHSAAAAKRG